MELEAIKSLKGCDPDNNPIYNTENIIPSKLSLSPLILVRTSGFDRVCEKCNKLKRSNEFVNPIECYPCYVIRKREGKRKLKS